MKIKLNNMKIRNFKGIKEFDFILDGESVNVAGDNGSGKTTLYDAFLWLMFGKDSKDKAQFDWKPLDDAGSEIHHLETEVIAELEVNGSITKLSRMIKENWTKKRGSADESFTGHSTTFKINDLTVKKKDYEIELNKLISEDLFKLLTAVNYFPELMKWEDRREVLIGMVGDISDADVIAKNKELEALKPLVEERPAEELKALISQNLRQINKDLKAIPDRIDEVDRALPNIEGLNKDDLLKQKEALNKAIIEKQNEMASMKNSSASVALQSQLNESKIKYREVELDYNEKQRLELNDLIEEKNNLGEKIHQIKNKLQDLDFKEREFHELMKQKKNQLDLLNENRKELLERFYETRDRKIDTFEEHQMDCPTCGQKLPDADLIKLKDQHEIKVNEFMQERADELKQINIDGKEIADKIEALENEIAELLESNIESNEKEKNQLIEKENKLRIELEKIDNKLNDHKEKNIPFIESDEAKEIIADANKIKLEIEEGGNGFEAEIGAIDEALEVKFKELSGIDASMQALELHNKQSIRRNELIQQEQHLSVKYGELEQQLYLLEEFTRTKINLLTDSINDQFKFVKFKLFEEQINGGLTEICETTLNGVNYSTGLNNAGRINAGLDIINTLMKHHKVEVPIFIDNAEGINDIIEVDAQLITLSVSKHKRLNVSKL